MNHLLDILIPTFNNREYLEGTLRSLVTNWATKGIFKIIVINNGSVESCKFITHKDITVINAGENLGWEGGLKEGLKYSQTPFVGFVNDDIHVPDFSRLWSNQLLADFKDEKVGAVGPSSNVVMGMQNTFAYPMLNKFTTTFLIGFFMILRRSALDEVGGVDDTLPGGDDLDISIRLRDKGYKLICNRDVFIYHHGFKTGNRLHGTPDIGGGWNSYEMYEATNTALIKKHGFKKWRDCIMGAYRLPSVKMIDNSDIEAEIIRGKIKGEVILEMGCGDKKTVPNAVGIDLVKKDEVIDSLVGTRKSVADVEFDISQPLPFEDNYADTIIARHILEHMIDPIQVLKQWMVVLKQGGRIIIAVPNEDGVLSIPMNIEHKHAWTPPAIQSLVETVGLKVLEQIDCKNNISFVTVCEKP